MNIREKYPHISECRDYQLLVDNMTEKELAMVEKILVAYHSSIELIVPRDKDKNVVFDGNWQVLVKDNTYRATGFETTVLRWYESFEDTGDMIENIQNGVKNTLDIKYRNDNKTIGVEISTNNPKLDGWAYAHLELPATDYEIRDAMQQARCKEGKAQDCNIINCDIFPALRETRLMPTTLSELNFLAKRLAGLNEEEEIVLRALTDKIVKTMPKCKMISVQDIINHTYNLDKVSVISNVTTDEQLGQFVIENDAFEEIKQMPDSAIELLDKAAVGKKLRESEGGVFEGGMYVITSDYPYKEVYDGRTLPLEANENWFAFRLLVAKTPQDGLEEMENADADAEWLNLPVDKEDADYRARTGEVYATICGD